MAWQCHTKGLVPYIDLIIQQDPNLSPFQMSLIPLPPLQTFQDAEISLAKQLTYMESFSVTCMMCSLESTSTPKGPR